MSTMLGMTRSEALDYACTVHPGVWAEQRLGFSNPPHVWEWHELQMRERRLAVIAPREHGKTEVFSVIGTAHMAVHVPGSWQVVFSQTMDQAKAVLERIVTTMSQVAPDLVETSIRQQTKEWVFGNFSKVQVSSVGRSIRGAHPDRIVGDDILEEHIAYSAMQRKRLERWWFGTVGGMAHPGTTRPLNDLGRRVGRFPPTKITLVGTPFHAMDLLMSMQDNPMYKYVRYAAEFAPEERVPGMMAIEMS